METIFGMIKPVSCTVCNTKYDRSIIRYCPYCNHNKYNVVPMPGTETIVFPETTSPLSRQESGSHYKKYKIQPVEFCQANQLNYCESNIIKYVVRHRDKNGLEDLKKARHYIDLLMLLEYGEGEK